MIRQRDTYFDSLKFTLIFLVVLGHTIEVLMFKGESGNLLREMYVLIYTFHMPLFIFISGYFSKNASFDTFFKGLPSLIIPYCIFQFILTIPNIIDGTYHFIDFLLIPQRGMWYIMSLICWRFIACLCNRFKVKINRITILIALVLSLLVGFTPLSTPNLSISRTIVFLPFFLAGMYSTPQLIGKIRATNKIVPALIIIAISAVVILFLSKRPAFQYSLWGFMPYNTFSTWMVGFGFRAIMLGIAAMMCFSFINLSGNSFAKIGNNTLAIYLLHMPIVYIGFDALLQIIHFNVGLAGGIIVAILAIAICVALSKLKIIQFLLNPIDKINKKR